MTSGRAARPAYRNEKVKSGPTVKIRAVWLISVLLFIVSGCAPAVTTPGTVLPVTETVPTLSATNTPVLSGLWLAPSVPDALLQAAMASGLPQAASPDTAAVRLNVVDGLPSTVNGPSLWFYALAAPFPTVVDGVSFTDLKFLGRTSAVGFCEQAVDHDAVHLRGNEIPV